MGLFNKVLKFVYKAVTKSDKKIIKKGLSLLHTTKPSSIFHAVPNKAPELSKVVNEVNIPKIESGVKNIIEPFGEEASKTAEYSVERLFEKISEKGITDVIGKSSKDIVPDLGKSAEKVEILKVAEKEKPVSIIDRVRNLFKRNPEKKLPNKAPNAKPKAEVVKPETKVKAPKAEPKAEVAKPEAKVKAPKAEPKAEVAKPETKVKAPKAEPKAEVAKPEAKVKVPKAEPKAEVAKPETKVKAPKAEPKAEVAKPNAPKVKTQGVSAKTDIPTIKNVVNANASISKSVTKKSTAWYEKIQASVENLYQKVEKVFSQNVKPLSTKSSVSTSAKKALNKANSVVKATKSTKASNVIKKVTSKIKNVYNSVKSKLTTSSVKKAPKVTTPKVVKQSFSSTTQSANSVTNAAKTVSKTVKKVAKAVVNRVKSAVNMVTKPKTLKNEVAESSSKVLNKAESVGNKVVKTETKPILQNAENKTTSMVEKAVTESKKPETKLVQSAADKVGVNSEKTYSVASQSQGEQKQIVSNFKSETPISENIVAPQKPAATIKPQGQNLSMVTTQNHGVEQIAHNNVEKGLAESGSQSVKSESVLSNKSADIKNPFNLVSKAAAPVAAASVGTVVVLKEKSKENNSNSVKANGVDTKTSKTEDVQKVQNISSNDKYSKEEENILTEIFEKHNSKVLIEKSQKIKEMFKNNDLVTIYQYVINRFGVQSEEKFLSLVTKYASVNKIIDFISKSSGEDMLLRIYRDASGTLKSSIATKFTTRLFDLIKTNKIKFSELDPATQLAYLKANSSHLSPTELLGYLSYITDGGVRNKILTQWRLSHSKDEVSFVESKLGMYEDPEFGEDNNFRLSA